MTRTLRNPSSSVEDIDLAINNYIDHVINDYIDSIKEDLWKLNQQVHDHPETAFQEHATHDTITKFLEEHRSPVTRHAYGIDTAFEARSGNGTRGRLVNFNAEYDALPGLGHACGHNLICIASVAAYLGLSHLLGQRGELDGRVQLLGTPAEEGGGGKVLLLDAGAYEGVDVSLMAHASAEWAYNPPDSLGVAGQSTLAVGSIYATYTGRSAHAAANPWDGPNALDALVASYNNISLLRQQIHPDERVHGAILEAPRITNAIPAHTKVEWTIRSGTLARLEPLIARVKKCIEAGALATGCTVEITQAMPSYADVKVNRSLSEDFTAAVEVLGVKLQVLNKEPIAASTDMGNVSHALPGLHALVGIPTGNNTAFPHNLEFARAAGTREAFERFVDVAKGLAGTGLRVLMDDEFARRVNADFGTIGGHI